MDCSKLTDIPNTLGYCGTSIDFETSELLKYSLLILQEENHFRKCFYWGKIYGMQTDYHISFGYEKNCLCDNYYYSTDCINWYLLPNIDKVTKILAPLAISNFEGDPTTVLKVQSDNFRLPFVSECHFEESLPTILKEEDRLSAVVELIKHEAMIIPRGGWFKCPDSIVIQNPTFEGLSLVEASDLKSYVHARPPLYNWNTNLLTRPDYNYSLDFLDTIDLDVPHGCWSLKFEAGNQITTLQSLYWPGLTFYHKISTPDYGLIYLGHGKKNTALQYML